jgi:uncharacterized membrane protein
MTLPQGLIIVALIAVIVFLICAAWQLIRMW